MASRSTSALSTFLLGSSDYDPRNVDTGDSGVEESSVTDQQEDVSTS